MDSVESSEWRSGAERGSGEPHCACQESRSVTLPDCHLPCYTGQAEGICNNTRLKQTGSFWTHTFLNSAETKFLAPKIEHLWVKTAKVSLAFTTWHQSMPNLHPNFLEPDCITPVKPLEATLKDVWRRTSTKVMSWVLWVMALCLAAAVCRHKPLPPGRHLPHLVPPAI